MSVLGLMGNLEPLQPTTAPLSAAPSTPGERAGAAWDAAQSDDRYWNIQTARQQRADKIIGDYHAMTGEKLLNPFDNAPTAKEVADNLGQPTTVIYAKRLELLREKTRQAREGIGEIGGLPQGFLDVDSIDPDIASQSGGARARDEALTGTGNGLAAFAASAAGEMASPHGVASAFFPVSRLPMAAAERIGAGWLRNIGKEALLQGVVQGGVQAAASVVDFNTRKVIGTEQTGAQLAEEIMAAAAGGAVLGGAFRGTHLAIRNLMGHGAEVPPAVRDAALVVESKELYGDKNALNVAPAAHEAAIDKSVADIAMNRPATIGELPPAPREAPSERLSVTNEPVREPGAEAHIPATMEEAPTKLAPELVRLPEDATNLSPADREVIGRIQDIMDRVEELGGDFQQVMREGFEKIHVATAPEAAAGVTFTPQDRETFIRDSMQKMRSLMGEVASVAPEVQRLQKVVDAPRADEPTPFVTPAEEGKVGKPAGETPQDKSMEAQVKQLVAEEGAATSDQKLRYERAAQAEKEANVAVGCVGGGAM